MRVGPTRRGRGGTKREGKVLRTEQSGARSTLGRRNRRRLLVSLVVMTASFTVIGVRLVDVQGLQASRFAAVSENEYIHTVTLEGERGAILDRNGDELAMSIPQTTIYADPHQITDPAGDAQKLAAVLGVPATTIESELRTGSGFVYVARMIDDKTAAAIEKLNLTGIYSMKEPKRFDPAGQLASPLIGVVSSYGKGLSGLEYKYNSVLQGAPGKLVEEMDPAGGQIPGGLHEYQAPKSGDDIVLTLDEPLQYETEQALAKAIVAAKAKSGIALIMDSQNGDLLAAASLMMPDPSQPQTMQEPPAVPGMTTSSSSGAGQSGSSGTAQNKSAAPVETPLAAAFTDVYEPGSVNKLITISAALAKGVIVPSDVFSIPNTYQVAGTAFHDAEAHPTEHWTVTDILANSSNIGTIQIAQHLGKDNLVNYLHDYGLGQKTDINFPGESAGLLLPAAQWSGTSIATVPIGEGIGVTAVQMIAAYNTIANGGVYIAPRLVNGYLDANGKEHLEPVAPGHRVVSQSVSAQMTAMLKEVVRVGTGTAAAIPPYTVAGKTGTAYVVSPKGGYEIGHYVASFAGFAPAEKPAITAMVVINDTTDYGASASAPTFATITRDALEEMGIPPQKPTSPLPGVPLATTASAQGAGEVAGTPLPGLTTASTVVAPTNGNGSSSNKSGRG